MTSFFYENALVHDSKTGEALAMELIDDEGNYSVQLRLKIPKIVKLEELLGEN